MESGACSVSGRALVASYPTENEQRTVLKPAFNGLLHYLKVEIMNDFCLQSAGQIKGDTA